MTAAPVSGQISEGMKRIINDDFLITAGWVINHDRIRTVLDRVLCVLMTICSITVKGKENIAWVYVSRINAHATYQVMSSYARLPVQQV